MHRVRVYVYGVVMLMWLQCGCQNDGKSLSEEKTEGYRSVDRTVTQARSSTMAGHCSILLCMAILP